jgi:ubiquinone/menaquinone biosynthesis C-methylase UbiE
MNTNINDKDGYMLATGQFADHRLKILDKLIGLHSRKFLGHVLKPGMHIAEIGCGTGNMLEWLSKQVGSEGKVYAVDLNEEQLRVVNEKVENLNLKNV